MQACLRACTLPWHAPIKSFAASCSASHRSTGTRNFSSVKFTANTKRLSYCAGRVWHLGTCILKPARTRCASAFLGELETLPKALRHEPKALEIGELYIASRLPIHHQLSHHLGSFPRCIRQSKWEAVVHIVPPLPREPDKGP